jgi:hypothetical protein
MKELKLTTDQLYEICNKVWIQAQRKYYEPLMEKGFRFTYNEILKSLEQPEEKEYCNGPNGCEDRQFIDILECNECISEHNNPKI